MSTSLSADQYATNWCQLLMKENEACQHGVDFANQLLKQNLKPSEIMNQCTNWGVSDLTPNKSDPYAATEGFRYGCYLNTALHGDPQNLCRLDFVLPNDDHLSMPYMCPDTCKNLFSSSGEINDCHAQSQKIYDTLIDGNKKCVLNESMSCIYGLGSSDQSTAADKAAQLPTVIGCTLGKMQSQMLYHVQKLQQDRGLNPVVSCLDFTSYKPGGNKNGGDGQAPDNSNNGTGLANNM